MKQTKMLEAQSQQLDTTKIITVGVPSFNHAHFIQDTLESISASNWKNIELIVIDDGSSDDSFEITEKWVKQNKTRFNCIHIEKQKNSGICKTLNKIFNLATGDFVAVLASDDLLDKDSLRLRAAALSFNENADAVYSDSRLISAEGITYGRTLHLVNRAHIPSLLSSSFQFLELLFCWSGCGPGLMLRKRNHRYPQIGPFCEALPFEDVEFFLRMALQRKLLYIPNVLQSYRVSDQSFSHSKERKEIIIRGHEQALRVVSKHAGTSARILIFFKFLKLKTAESNNKLVRAKGRYTIGVLCYILLLLNRSLASLHYLSRRTTA